MSYTPGTRVITVRLNKKKDADIFLHLAQSDNYTQMIKDAIRYYFLHEEEAKAELYHCPIGRKRIYT